MTVEIWTDITCPFCYIGKHNFLRALQQFSSKQDVEIRFRSFELDPRAAREYPGTLFDWLAKRYGRTLEQVAEMNEPVIQQAAALGLKFRLDLVKPTNSFDAHRLLHLAASENKAEPVIELLFKAYFTEGKNISQLDVLLEAGTSVGLSKSEVELMLASDDFKDDVRADELDAQKLSVRGVPFFLFNRRRSLSGAQPVNVFLEALKTES
jgi:predicted DsbA family dithiol-disulfide isomerase